MWLVTRRLNLAGEALLKGFALQVFILAAE